MTSISTLLPATAAPPSLKNTASSLIKVGLAKCAVLVLKVVSCVSSIFSHSLQAQCKSLIRQITIIHIQHNLADIRRDPCPILVASRNVNRKDVVRTATDIAATVQFKRRLSLLYPGSIKAKGPRPGGVCLGASIHIIRTLIDRPPSSEQELCQCLMPFINGFPAEVGGLQRIGYELYKREDQQKKASIEQLSDTMRAELKAMEQEAIEANTPFKEVEAATEQCMQTYRQGLQAIREQPSFYINRVAALVGLQSNERSIDAPYPQELGFYMFSLEKTRTARHVMILANFSFGNYVFDPNYGLLSVQHLDALFTHYAKLGCNLVAMQELKAIAKS